MKELSIEEKAKRYDEAIKVAQRFYNNSVAITKKGLEDIFSELKEESEDEKIRKALINGLKRYDDGTLFNGCLVREILAWLEKQGKPAKLSEEEQNRFAKGVLSSCALSFIDYLDAHKNEGKMCVSNGECEDIENAFHNAMWDRLHRYYCKYIEKQGEQNPIDKIQLGKKYKCIASPRYSTFFRGEIYKPEDEFLCSLMNFCSDCFEPIEEGEQKPADKVEPKFKVGDEIKTKNEESFTITRIDRWGYWSEDLFICNFDDADKWELVEPAWSEEDENLFRCAIDAVKQESKVRTDGCLDEEVGEMVIDWLKSLKDRVQPKQEWSEDDKKMIGNIRSIIEKYAFSQSAVDVNGELCEREYIEAENWLKSLRPQNRWKPSVEQMNALNDVISSRDIKYDVLSELWKDLKKLK